MDVAFVKKSHCMLGQISLKCLFGNVVVSERITFLKKPHCKLDIQNTLLLIRNWTLTNCLQNKGSLGDAILRNLTINISNGIK